jgi:hypothetical protein
MQHLIEQGRIIQTRPGAVPQYKRYLDEMPGVSIQNLWDDIPVINNLSRKYWAIRRRSRWLCLSAS